MRALLLSLCLISAPAHADVEEAIDGPILRGYAGFAAAAAQLDRAAQASCAATDLRPHFLEVADRWMEIGFLHLGPAEERGRALAILFWPDPKGLGAKAQRALLTGDPAKLEPAVFADQSVAARGISGLERLLWPTEALPADPCSLIRATTADLSRMAEEILAEWQGTGGFAAVLRAPETAGNPRLLNRQEVRQALFTQLATGLEFIADARIGRPLGTFDRPRPERAEARASGRAARNVELSLIGLQGFAEALALRDGQAAIPQTRAAFSRAIQLAQRLDDPTFQAIEDPQAWLKLEILQQAVRATRDAVLAEIGPVLEVGVGFNSQDGD